MVDLRPENKTFKRLCKEIIVGVGWVPIVIVFLLIGYLGLLVDDEFVNQKKITEEHNKIKLSYDAGINVVGYDCLGYIENTNYYPVMIREVWSGSGSGETTEWYKRFEPGHRIEQEIMYYHAFYIYDESGSNLIGFVRVEK